MRQTDWRCETACEKKDRLLPCFALQKIGCAHNFIIRLANRGHNIAWARNMPPESYTVLIYTLQERDGKIPSCDLDGANGLCSTKGRNLPHMILTLLFHYVGAVSSPVSRTNKKTYALIYLRKRDIINSPKIKNLSMKINEPLEYVRRLYYLCFSK